MSSFSYRTLVYLVFIANCWVFVPNSVSLIAPLAHGDSGRDVVLVLDLSGHFEPGHGPEDWIDNYRFSTGLPVRFARAKSAHEIPQKVKEALKTNDRVSHFVLSGHGFSQFNEFTIAVDPEFTAHGEARILGSTYLNFMENNDPNYFNENGRHGGDYRLQFLDELFLGLSERFTQHPVIYVSSCNLLKGVRDQNRIKNRFKSIMSALGIQSATVFMANSIQRPLNQSKIRFTWERPYQELLRSQMRKRGSLFDEGWGHIAQFEEGELTSLSDEIHVLEFYREHFYRREFVENLSCIERVRNLLNL